MKVLLLTPPYYVPTRSFAISVGQPLGIAYVGAALRRAGHEVHLLDGLMGGLMRGVSPDSIQGHEEDRVRISRGVFQRHPLGPPFPPGATIVGMSFEAIEARIRELKPDVVGISTIFTSIYRSAAHIAALVKRIDPRIITLMGGTHVTVSAETVLKDEAVDYIITGEGENSAVALLAALEQGRVPRDIPGVGFRQRSGRPHHIPNSLNWELDELAMPALDLLEMEDYFACMAEGRVAKLYTTRGCPFNCSFCSVPLTSQRRFRAHGVERIMAEVSTWVERFGVEGLVFEDDNMNTNRKHYQAMLIALRDSGYKLSVDARNLRCDLLDEETLALMKQVGFGTVWITPETGSQRVMDEVINKRMKVSDAEQAARRILKAGLDVGAAFVIGFPGETRAEIQQTIDFAYHLKSLGVRNFWWSIATPIMGTALYQSALDSGLITGIDLDSFTYNSASFDTEHFSGAEIEQLRHQLMEDLNRDQNSFCGKPDFIRSGSRVAAG